MTNLRVLMARRWNKGRLAYAPLIATLALLFAFSIYLASTRVYQVDECYTVAMARLIALDRTRLFQTDPSALPILLSGLSRGTQRARYLFADARWAMLALFWLNLVLLAACTGARLRSRRGLIALLTAATLAPLWEYGFEIRHDNALLAGLLLTWWLLRVRPGGLRSYYIAGVVAVSMQFVAFKAFAYTMPLSAAFLMFPPPDHLSRRRALILSWIAGAATALAAARAIYGALGLWPAYMDDFRRMSAATAHVRHFLPVAVAGKFLVETPLLFATLAFAFFLLFNELRRNGAAAWNWDGSLPEATLTAGAFAVLLVNPTPYAYNLLFLIPFAYLAVGRCASGMVETLLDRGKMHPRIWTLLLLLHGVPFAAATFWEAMWSNSRQAELMDLTESLTAPQEPVFDGVGLVPTRPSVGYHWLLDTLNIRPFVDGSGPSVRDQLARDPAAVFIPNYRTDWLTEEDRRFLGQHYVPLSDDLRILGTTLPQGGGDFEVMRAGRYNIAARAGSDRAEGRLGRGATLDGARFLGGVVALSAGRHRLRVDASVDPEVAWLGPRLERLPSPAWSDHRRLFVDWY